MPMLERIRNIHPMQEHPFLILLIGYLFKENHDSKQLLSKITAFNSISTFSDKILNVPCIYIDEYDIITLLTGFKHKQKYLQKQLS